MGKIICQENNHHLIFNNQLCSLQEDLPDGMLITQAQVSDFKNSLKSQGRLIQSPARLPIYVTLHKYQFRQTINKGFFFFPLKLHLYQLINRKTRRRTHLLFLQLALVNVVGHQYLYESSNTLLLIMPSPKFSNSNSCSIPPITDLLKKKNQFH